MASVDSNAPDWNAAEKAELHLHLRGAIPPSVLAGLIDKYSVAGALRKAPARHLEMFEAHPNIRRVLRAEGDDGGLDRLFEYGSFDQFLATYLFTSYFFSGIDDFRKLVQGVRAELGRQNIVYAEITVSLIEYVGQGIPLEALVEVLEEPSEGPERVVWIVDLVRNIGPERAEQLVRDVLSLGARRIVGITLGGAEHLFPPAQFARVYDIARDGALKLTVHAGEALGPESVWDALRILRVDRIGHGVRAIDDPKLIEHLAEHQVPLEVCPTSNVRTGVYSSLAEHPIRRLFDAGVPITVSTDDPTFFGVTLAEELGGLSDLGFSPEEVHSIAGNAFRYAFA